MGNVRHPGVGSGRGPRRPQQNRSRVELSVVRERIATLQDYPLHMTMDEIAHSAGVGRHTIHNIIVGRVRFVNKGTADAILNCEPFKFNQPMDVIPALGTMRRIRALAVHGGWTGPQIAERSGVGTTTVQRLRSEYDDTTRRHVAEKIKKVYDELWDKQNPHEPSRIQAKAHALRKRWHPPAAWDDETIDLREGKPSGSRYQYELGEELTG